MAMVPSRPWLMLFHTTGENAYINPPTTPTVGVNPPRLRDRYIVKKASGGVTMKSRVRNSGKFPNVDSESKPSIPIHGGVGAAEPIPTVCHD